MDPQKIAAVILAGGEGRRLGGTLKSQLVIEGRRLIERVTARLASCMPILVAHGPHAPEALSLRSGLVPVGDLPNADGVRHAGPIAGLVAAVDWLQKHGTSADLLVSVAVDTPGLPEDYVERLVAAINGQAAVIARHGDSFYPTNGLWRLDALSGLPEAHARGAAHRSLKRLAESLSAGQLDWAGWTGQDPFASINTPDDLVRAGRSTAAM